MHRNGALTGSAERSPLRPRHYNIAVNALDTGKVKFKKTSWTDEYFASLPVEYRARFADSSLVTPAFVYLAMQRANGVTGQTAQSRRALRSHPA